MPKGRGANQRRRSERQLHPKDKRVNTERGYLRLYNLGERAIKVQKKRHKERKKQRETTT